jgi:LemA protein
MAARADSSAGPAQMAQAENVLGRSLGGLFAVAESYPQLGSNQNFLELQRALSDTEDRIAAGRRFYNGNVRVLNTRVEAFPSSIVASLFHFTKAEYFETEDPAVRANPRVDFSGVGADPSVPRPTPSAGATLPSAAPQQPQGGYSGPPPVQPGQYGPPPGSQQYPGGPPR